MFNQTVRDEMIAVLDRGNAIATTSGAQIDGVPVFQTLHSGPNDPPVDHLGFGLFRGYWDGVEFTFDGGGAMRSVNDRAGNWLFSWTPVVAPRETLAAMDLDLDRQRAGILAEPVWDTTE